MKNKLTIFAAMIVALFALATMSFAQKCTEDGSIRSVKKARAGNFETVTFDVNSPSPDYDVKNERPPFEYTGETPVKVKGNYFKTVNFRSVMWTCEIATDFLTRTTQIRDIKLGEQFEGYVTFIIGYRKRSKFVSTTASTANGKTKIVLKFRR